MTERTTALMNESTHHDRKDAPRVAAVFASYNRREVALECVRCLRAQTIAPEFVVVADNASEDGSPDALRAIGWDAIEVLDLGDNLGNAGGIMAAMEHAFARGADAVWILDDDSWPRPEALAALLGAHWDPRVVRHAIQVDRHTGRFTWPLHVDNGAGGWNLIWSESEMGQDVLRSRASWTGALVSRQIRDAVGPVKGELFIRGEDEEYPWRIRRAGFATEAVRQALMDHPGPTDLVHWKFFDKNLFLERGLVDWKLYYKVRNMVWLKRQQSGAWGAFWMATAYVIGVLIVDGPGRFPLLLRAIKDGWFGRLGKMASS